jgi:hypothetical protein
MDDKPKKVLPECFTEDYGHALIHLAWLFDKGVRTLVFGYAELMPTEYPDSDITPEQNLRIDSSSSERLFFIRMQMSVDDTLSSYLEVFDTGRLVLPIGRSVNGIAQTESIVIDHPMAEPVWPNLVLSNGIPYASHYGVNVRSHHAYPARKSPILEELQNNDKVIKWLHERLFFSLEEYDELLGSFHIIAHNPVYRSFNAKLMPSKDARPESVIYSFVPRAAKKTDTLKLLHYEERLTGHCMQGARPVDEHLLVQELSGVAQKVGHMVVCSKRGLLDWSDPCGFLRQMSISIGVMNRKSSITVPSRKSSEPPEKYEVTRVTNDLPKLLGEDASPESWKNIRMSQRRRELEQQARQHGQRWYYDEPDEARRFVREIISKARGRVWIVDPYFTTPELFSFALATTNTAAKITVVTSAEALKFNDCIEENSESGEVLLKQLPQFKNVYDIEVKVLTGDQAPIHDRFLIIDNEAWLVGNSLHTLGKRAGMMIKLPYPEPVIENLREIINNPSRSKDLSDWVSERINNREASCDEDS